MFICEKCVLHWKECLEGMYLKKNKLGMAVDLFELEDSLVYIVNSRST